MFIVPVIMRTLDILNYKIADLFSNIVAMRELAAMMPLASLKFAIPTKLDGTSVLSSVSELRLVVGENHNLVATLTQLPKLKILELSDERRCSCVVRLPPMPQLISLTLAIHSCPSDRYELDKE